MIYLPGTMLVCFSVAADNVVVALAMVGKFDVASGEMDMVVVGSWDNPVNK